VKPDATSVRVLLAIALAAALLHLVGEALPSPALRLATKALPALCLAVWVRMGTPSALRRLVASGLFLSALGDLLLEIGLFLAGLVAFLLAHVAYAVAFLSVTRRLSLVRAIPFALYGALFWLYLRPGLGALAGPVLAYTAAICTMLWRAAARVGSPGDDERSAWLGLLGALLFAASDSLIALDRFHGPLGSARHAILPLYWLGQLGIAASASPHAVAALVSSPAEDE
jgi:uncharacterized membrane protein YhhN